MRTIPTKFHVFKIGDLIYWKSLAIITGFEIDHGREIVWLCFLKSGRKERYSKETLIGLASIIVDF